jgi:hypothetical protein
MLDRACLGTGKIGNRFCNEYNELFFLLPCFFFSLLFLYTMRNYFWEDTEQEVEWEVKAESKEEDTKCKEDDKERENLGT